MSTDLTTMAANGALPVSTRDRQRFIPAHYYTDGALTEGAPVYFLTPLTVTERRALNREVVGACGMFVTTKEIRQAMREGAVAGLEEDEAAQATSQLDLLEQLEGVPNHDDSSAALLAATREAVTHWSMTISRLHRPLSRLMKTQLEQIDALSVLGVRACVRGWENLSGPCRRKGGFVTEEALAVIPEDDLEALSERCLVLREVSADQEPDSASP